jgi:geranylgeranyl diphosphate synthase type I
MGAFDHFYKEMKARIEQNMIEKSDTSLGGNSLLYIGESYLRAMQVGGKRLRGTLVYIGYQMVNDGSLESADSLAVAFEAFQTAILVHDDIIDRAVSRRGQETIHMRYYHRYVSDRDVNQKMSGEHLMDMGRSLALCLGDLGLYQAEQILVDTYQNYSCFGTLLTYYHTMMMNTIKGELIDVQLPNMERYELWDKEEMSVESLEQMILDIYHLKTSCYTVIGPLCCGMLLGGAPDHLIKKMEEIADALGIAFQLQDDILGIFGTQDEIGKDVGSDISEFKQTLLYSYTKEFGGELYQELMQYYGRNHLTQKEILRVREIFQQTGALLYVENKIAELFDDAVSKLDAIDEINADRKVLLREFISYLVARKA